MLHGPSVSSNSFVISAAATATLSFATQPNSTTAGTTLNSVNVLAKDQYGNDVPGLTLTMGISTNTLSGTLTATTSAAGLAVFNTLAVDLVGTYTLTASVGSLSAESNQFVISAGAAASLAWNVQPQNTVAGVAINSPGTWPEVRPLDQYGNVVDGVSVNLVLSAGGTRTAPRRKRRSATGRSSAA